jgi:Ni/Fe-hydrogenase 1 B-type cytochrome subunit
MSSQCKFKRYIWELPVRWCHWINVLSIVTLSVTGFLIGYPISLGHSTSDFTMGWIRFIHFTTAYLFTVSVLSRLVWAFIGNQYAGWMEFFPLFSEKGRGKLVRMLRYYFLIDKEVPETIGHNPLAATAYSLLFCFYLIMIVTGFALYSEHAPNGAMHAALGWVTTLVSNQGLRLIHHLSMWCIFGFVINHIYSAWLMDIKEHGAEISSIFSGFRFTVHKEKE